MRLACLLLIAACGTSSPPDVVGPFTGTTHTYYIDAFTLPMHSTEARAMGDDLDGDHMVDNWLGSSIGALAGLGNDITTHGGDMLAAGVIKSRFEILADDLDNDETVGVRYVGDDDDAASMMVGGTLRNGVFVSNRTRTSQELGAATLHLPVLVDADPITFAIHDMELDLTSDGHGGYDAIARGLVGPEILDVAAAGLAQMIANNPADHAGLIQILDEDRSDDLSARGLQASPALQSFFAPDIDRDGTRLISFGFGFHLAQAPLAGPPADLCHDRIRDGDEADVDCGGSCLACAGGATCSAPAECQTGMCNGTCTAVACNDGVKDGLESDVDCGGWECGPCVTGHHCVSGADCQSMVCLSSGLCQGVM